MIHLDWVQIQLKSLPEEMQGINKGLEVFRKVATIVVLFSEIML